MEVAGTPGAKADHLADRHFGNSQTLVVLLQGPRSQIDRQGRPLAARLDRLKDVAVLGPWAPGAGRKLRPRPGRALLLLRIDRRYEDASRYVTPVVRQIVAHSVHRP